MNVRARSLASVALGAIVASALGACTGGPSGPSSTPPPTTTTATRTPVVSVSAGPGVYVYQNAGLTATLHLTGDKGTLLIDNGTGNELAAPGFYLLDARDGHRVDGTVDGAKATPDGSTSTFDVSFSGLQVWNIGLAVLLIGPDNEGAFVPR